MKAGGASKTTTTNGSTAVLVVSIQIVLANSQIFGMEFIGFVDIFGSVDRTGLARRCTKGTADGRQLLFFILTRI
jgi:hypothetical protein